MKLVSYPVIFLGFLLALPAAAAIPGSKTGQTACYDAAGAIISCPASGQDGELQVGIDWPNPRFRDNGNETLTDLLTGLTWPKDANTFGPDSCTPGISKSWQEALDFVKCLNGNSYLGFNTWHLPNVTELTSVVNYGANPNSAWLGTIGFRNLYTDSYWTSTSNAVDGQMAWSLSLHSGEKAATDKLAALNVLPVKSDPDLVVASVAVPSSLSTEQTISVPVVTKNQGAVGAGYHLVTIYLSSDSVITTGDIAIGEYRQMLNAGAEVTKNQTVTIPVVDSGTYYIGAIIDRANEVAESDEANNSLASAAVTITRRYPDLVVTSVAVPSSLSTEQTISVPVVTKNQGAVGAGYHLVTIYLSSDSVITTGDIAIGEYRQMLNAGAEVTKNQTVTIPVVDSGTYYIGAIIDRANEVAESDEGNNSLAASPMIIANP